MRRARACAALGALVAMAASHVIGEDAPAVQAAKLEFRVIATSWGSGTHPGGSWMSTLREGSSTAASMQVKLSPPPEGWRPALGAPPSGCESNVVMQTGPAAPVGPFPLWQVEATVRHVEMDKIVIGYEWRRRSETGPVSVPEAADQGEATLAEGGRVLLDYVPVADASADCYRNLALELSASIPEDPAFENRRIGYDLWLVSEDHGKRLTRRLQLIGKQGEGVEFDFGTFRSQLRGIALPRRPISTSDIMEMTVSGSIRSRIQPDGSLELRLVAHRSARPSEGRWATAAHGEKRIRASAGETLRLELPPPASIAGVEEPETFKTIAEQRVALVLTPALVE